jgi:hypothetical protein
LPSTITSSLLRHVYANDQEAWDRMGTPYYPMVYGWCRRDEAIEFIFAIFLKNYVDFAQKHRRQTTLPINSINTMASHLHKL